MIIPQMKHVIIDSKINGICVPRYSSVDFTVITYDVKNKLCASKLIITNDNMLICRSRVCTELTLDSRSIQYYTGDNSMIATIENGLRSRYNKDI